MGDQIGSNVPWFAYRLYGANNRLLYSGSTNNLERRFYEHRGHRWWADIARVEVDEFPSRWRAALAERLAGKGEHGWIRAGIGKGIAASMTDEELVEAIQHPAYARFGDISIANRWGIPVAKIRRLMLESRRQPIPEVARYSAADPVTLLKVLGKR